MVSVHSKCVLKFVLRVSGIMCSVAVVNPLIFVVWCTVMKSLFLHGKVDLRGRSQRVYNQMFLFDCSALS